MGLSRRCVLDVIKVSFGLVRLSRWRWVYCLLYLSSCLLSMFLSPLLGSHLLVCNYIWTWTIDRLADSISRPLDGRLVCVTGPITSCFCLYRRTLACDWAALARQQATCSWASTKVPEARAAPPPRHPPRHAASHLQARRQSRTSRGCRLRQSVLWAWYCTTCQSGCRGRGGANARRLTLWAKRGAMEGVSAVDVRDRPAASTSEMASKAFRGEIKEGSLEQRQRQAAERCRRSADWADCVAANSKGRSKNGRVNFHT